MNFNSLYKLFLNIKILEIVFILIFISFLTIGCSEKNVLPVYNNIKTTKSVMLYGQKIFVPEELKNNLFPRVLIKKTHSINRIVSGKMNNGEFLFHDNKSPYYILSLAKKLKITSLTIYNTARYAPMVQRKSNDLISLALGTLPDTPKFPSLLYIGTKENDKLFPYKTNFAKKDSDLKVKKEKILFNRPLYTNEVHISINKLRVSIWHNDLSKLSRNYKFSIEGYNPSYEKKLIVWTLKNRKDIEENESLIRNIALKNIKLYRSLQIDTRVFNIPKYSIIKLPKDVDLEYALLNTFEIYRTGRYKSLTGRFKRFKIDKIKFKEEKEYKYKKHSVKVKGNYINNINQKDTFQKNKKIKFIDFSQGL